MATRALPPSVPKRWLPAWLRGSKLRRRARRLQLVETLPLGERRMVAVVSLDGREFLIGATPQAIALLSEIEADLEPELEPELDLDPEAGQGPVPGSGVVQ